MKFLFFGGFVLVLFGLIVGIMTGNYLLGILIILAGIGVILFSLPFLALPIPVDVNIRMELTDGSDGGVNFDKDAETGNDNDDPGWGNVPDKPI